MITNNDAIRELAKIHHSVSGVYISGKCESDLSGVTLTDGSVLAFTFDDVLAKKAELIAAEPMRQLRQQRGYLLSATDWWCVSDRTPTPEQLAYRQALRDLPATQTPALDENGNLTGVTWPEKPE